RRVDGLASFFGGCDFASCSASSASGRAGSILPRRQRSVVSRSRAACRSSSGDHAAKSSSLGSAWVACSCMNTAPDGGQPFQSLMARFVVLPPGLLPALQLSEDAVSYEVLAVFTRCGFAGRERARRVLLDPLASAPAATQVRAP